MVRKFRSGAAICNVKVHVCNLKTLKMFQKSILFMQVKSCLRCKYTAIEHI